MTFTINVYHLLVFLLGVILGYILHSVVKKAFMTKGIITVDHNTRECNVAMNSSEIIDKRITSAYFVVMHKNLSQ